MKMSVSEEGEKRRRSGQGGGYGQLKAIDLL